MDYCRAAGTAFNDKSPYFQIIQDMIPGNDEYMRVLTSYSDRNGKVKMMCLGHVLLEEHTPHGLGNHAVIITEPNQELMGRVKNLLEDLHYVGFSNFDIKYDPRDGEFKFFEINLRQGRSSFYVTLNGYNLAKWYIDDYVEDALKDKETVYGNKLESKYKLWLGVPKKIFNNYAYDNDYKTTADELIREGRYGTTVFYDKDRNFKRWLLMKYMFHNYFKRYKTYYEVNKGKIFDEENKKLNK